MTTTREDVAVPLLSDEVREDIRRQVAAAPPPTDAQISVLRSIFATSQVPA